MTPDKYQPPAGYLTLKQAQERLGVSKTKAWQLARPAAGPYRPTRRTGEARLYRGCGAATANAARAGSP